MSLKGYIKEGASLTEDENGISENQIWDLPVVADGPDFLWTAREHRGPPQKGDRHPRDPSLTVTSRTIVDLGGGKARVSIQYSPNVNESEEPIGTVTDIRYDGTSALQDFKTDIYGQPLISGTSAFTVSSLTPTSLIEVDRVESQPPGFSFLRDFMDRVNSTSFSGFPSRTLLMFAPRSRKIKLTGDYLITYVFQVDLNTFDVPLEQVNLELVEKAQSSGAFILEPSTTNFVKSVQVVRKDYRIKKEAEFNSLGFQL